MSTFLSKGSEHQRPGLKEIATDSQSHFLQCSKKPGFKVNAWQFRLALTKPKCIVKNEATLSHQASNNQWQPTDLETPKPQRTDTGLFTRKNETARPPCQAHLASSLVVIVMQVQLEAPHDTGSA
jgi:hypothetical protein